jgi:hypothetical protein
MAQHDYIIANQSGAAFRADLNVALAAVATNNSQETGPSQPDTTYRFQWWADPNTGLLKIRNAANNAWITVGTLADANLGLLSLAGGTLTGALLADDSGTAALPAIAFDGDTNTGIFRAGADQLGIATNGVERVEFGTSEVVFNDGGADVDFRVEGDTKANLFKVDAGTDTVIIDGITQPSADGTDRQVIATNGSGVLSFASRASIVRGTAVASTSGVSIAFTSLPTWVRKLTIVLSGVSTNGTADILLRLSTGGVFASSGYVSNMQVLQGGTSSSGVNNTVGFVISQGSTSVITTGTYQFINNAGNGWIGTGVFAYEHAVVGAFGAGRVTLGGTLDGIQIVTANGSDTFDAGSVNIIYEG